MDFSGLNMTNIIEMAEKNPDPDKLADLVETGSHSGQAVTRLTIQAEDPESLKIADSRVQMLERFDSIDIESHGKEVKNLPIEDTVWFICKMFEHAGAGGEDCNHDNRRAEVEGALKTNELRCLLVMDKHKLVHGVNQMSIAETSLAQQAFHLICISALHPMTGKPRKPKCVSFTDPDLGAKATGLDLTQLGIRFLCAGLQTEEEVDEYVRMRECAVCRLRGSQELFKKCSSCHAIHYCSRLCQKKDWSDPDRRPVHCHKNWCKKMKAFMEKTEQLKEFPFTFSTETSSDVFTLSVYRKFLEQIGVYNQGMWIREYPAWMQNGKFVEFGELDTTDGVVLPVESSILDDDPGEMEEFFRDWKGYYDFRHFRLDSPIAILLQFPLTLYYIVKFCLPIDCTSWWENVDIDELCIDIVGVEKEVEMIPLFSEAARLLSYNALDIHMYGKEISRKLDGKIFKSDGVSVKVLQKLYHKRSDQERKPHLVIGFNAGLAAYKSWTQTLVHLRTTKVPAYFTDFCQYSCECSKKAIEELALGTISEPVINPFRSPVRKLAEENDMPWFSNGFLFHLIYPY